MAWRRPSDKPLSEPMMVILLTNICVIGPQWLKMLVYKSDLVNISYHYIIIIIIIIIIVIIIVNSPHKWPVSRKMLPFDDVIMSSPYYMLDQPVDRITRSFDMGIAVSPAQKSTLTSMGSLNNTVSQEICTRFCCVLHCCGYAIVHNEFT